MLDRQPNLEVVLRGPAVQGRISVDYLITLAKEIQTTLRRIAANQESKTGRYKRDIERACSLDFVGFAPGSVRLDFRLAPLAPEDHTLWPDAGRESLSRFIDVLAAGEKGTLDWANGLSGSVLDGLARMTRSLDDGVQEINFKLDEHRSDAPVRSARVTRAFREHVRPASLPPRSPTRTTVVGVIWEADWKDHTAELYQHDGNLVRVRFDADRDEEITGARRMKVAVTGDAIPSPDRVQEIVLDRLEVLEPLPLEQPSSGPGFWETPTIADLIEQQDTQRSASIEELAGDWPEDESLDEFLSAVREGRR